MFKDKKMIYLAFFSFIIPGEISVMEKRPILDLK